MNIEDMKEYLKSNLSKYRYEHSIRVAEEARKLAKHYDCNDENAYIAGLLHDIAKEYNEEENKEIVNKYNLDKSVLEDKRTCHAIIGSVIVKELYNVSDDICQTIKYHTVGNRDMTLFDKIIFIADKIESGKNYPGIEEERDMAYIDLDRCLLLCLMNTKRKLEQDNKIFNKDSEKLLDYLYSKINTNK